MIRFIQVASFLAAIVIADTSSAVDVPNLKDQLEVGLKARRPSEFAFIATVVNMVEMDELPVSIVNGAFNWARENKQPYPFPYFERSLRTLAARRGIQIP